MVGCENRQDFKLLKTLLKDFEVIPLNSAISVKAVELFEKFRLMQPNNEVWRIFYLV